MRKTLLSISLFIFLSATTSFAQDQKGVHSVQFGLGSVSAEDFTNFSEDLVRGMISVLTTPYNAGRLEVIRSNSPTFFFGYNYAFHKRIIVGLSGSFESTKGKFLLNDQVIGTFSRAVYTIAPEVYFVYNPEEKTKFYSHFGLGKTFYKETTTLPANKYSYPYRENHVSFQLSPIGVTFGDKFAGFAELGYGYKGILTGGLRYNF